MYFGITMLFLKEKKQRAINYACKAGDLNESPKPNQSHVVVVVLRSEEHSKFLMRQYFNT